MLKEITTKVSPETHDAGKLLGDILKGLFAKKPITEIAVGELAQLKETVDGILELPAEAKANAMASLRAIIIPLSESLEGIVNKALNPAPASLPDSTL